MEIVTIEKRTFEELMERLEHLLIRVKAYESPNDTCDWLDSDDMCSILKISKRTLQTFRDKELVAYSRIKHKIYYRKEEVLKLLKKEVCDGTDY